MKEKTNTLVPATAILALLCVAYSLITWQQKRSGESSQHREEEQIHMTDIEGIPFLSWEKDGQGLFFEEEGDIWYYQADGDCPIRQHILSMLVDTLSRPGVERRLDTPGSLVSYGLDAPSIRLETWSKNNIVRTILVGSQTAGVGDAVPGYVGTVAEHYACVEDSDQVYTIGNYLTGTAGEGLYDLVGTESLPHMTGADAREITMTKEGKTSYLLKKTIGGENNIAWCRDFMDQEENRLSDDVALSNLAQTIDGLSVQSCTTYRATDEELGSLGPSTPVMTLLWTCKKGEDSDTVTLAVGSPGDEGTSYYTRKGDSGAINLISKEAVEECLNAVFPEQTSPKRNRAHQQSAAYTPSLCSLSYLSWSAK